MIMQHSIIDSFEIIIIINYHNYTGRNSTALRISFSNDAIFEAYKLMLYNTEDKEN